MVRLSHPSSHQTFRFGQYIERLTSRRAEEGYDVVDDINDERNGVYLNADMELGFGYFFGLMKVCDSLHVLYWHERKVSRRRISR